MVMLYARGVEWGDVVNELARRQDNQASPKKRRVGDFVSSKSVHVYQQYLNANSKQSVEPVAQCLSAITVYTPSQSLYFIHPDCAV